MVRTSRRGRNKPGSTLVGHFRTGRKEQESKSHAEKRKREGEGEGEEEEEPLTPPPPSQNPFFTPRLSGSELTASPQTLTVNPKRRCGGEGGGRTWPRTFKNFKRTSTRPRNNPGSAIAELSGKATTPIMSLCSKRTDASRYGSGGSQCSQSDCPGCCFFCFKHPFGSDCSSCEILSRDSALGLPGLRSRCLLVKRTSALFKQVSSVPLLHECLATQLGAFCSMNSSFTQRATVNP